MKTTYAALALALSLALAACSTGTGDRAVDPSGPSGAAGGAAGGATGGATGGAMPTAIPAATGVVETVGLATVLDDGDGPQLCLGGVMESFPPQCGGPRLLGWDWADHPEHQRANGVRWGDFHLTGTFDGTDVTVGDTVIPAALYDAPPVEDEPLGTPCEAPEGGWQVVDPAKATPEAMDEVFRVAETLPGLALAWMDQRGAAGTQSQMNDPTGIVVNVAVTGDRAGAESTLREVWGGALCVSGAEHTQRELLAIAEELNALPGMLSSGGAARPDHLDVGVVHDDGSLQAWVDQEYGTGLVLVSSALVPAGSLN